MKEQIKTTGAWVLIIAVLIIISGALNMLIDGGVWAGVNVYPFLQLIMCVTLPITFLVFAPLSLIKGLRPMVGRCMVFTSYVSGITLWVGSLLLTYAVWGGFAVFIGIILMGIGVVPIAMLASVLNGSWQVFMRLVLLALLTYGIRLWGTRLIAGHEKQLPSYQNGYEAEG
jgi:hypothetical protein